MNGSEYPNSRQPPVDINALKRKTGHFLKGKLIIFILFISAVFLAFNSFFMLNSGEEAIMIRLGAYNKTITTPGLQFKIDRKSTRLNSSH